MIVLDASALLEVLLATAAAERVARSIFARGQTLHAPHVIDLEVAQVLRRYRREGEISEVRAEEALRDLQEFPLTRYPHDLFLPRIWELQESLTAYDGAYVALAEVLPAPLLTRDGRIGRSQGHRAEVQVL